MPTVEHESYMYEKLRAMGLRNELVNISRTTFRFGDFSKEADSSWKRSDQRRQREDQLLF